MARDLARRGSLRARTIVLVTVGALVTLGMGGRAPARNYVALGDSYTAGPANAVQDQSPRGCYRSDHNYPHLVAPHLALPVFRDVSCSGAETKDMTSSQSVSPPPNPLPQFHALDSSTRVVTLTIGGNDIGFT